MDALKGKVIEYAKELGFSEVKVISAQPLTMWDEGVSRRVQLDPDTAKLWKKMTSDPRKILPNARAIIVASRPYKPYRQEFPEGVGGYSAYYREYPKGRESIKKLAELLESKGYKAVVHPPLPAKAIACRAGIGRFGKNGLIHTREHGSWISIHYIVTDAPIPHDPEVEEVSDCGDCQKCMQACPTGAITDDGTVILSRCIRHHMLSSDFVPVDIREKMGTRLLGCDVCQMVCPRNRKGLEGAVLPSDEEMEPFNIMGILKEWKSGFKDRMGRMGRLVGQNYARARKVLSMAVILAGNTKDPAYVTLLAETLKHPHPPIRGHSAWALGKIGGIQSRALLMEALKKERDQQVIEEIKSALFGQT